MGIRIQIYLSAVMFFITIGGNRST
jgi:hypothetical protein